MPCTHERIIITTRPLYSPAELNAGRIVAERALANGATLYQARNAARQHVAELREFNA